MGESWKEETCREKEEKMVGVFEKASEWGFD